MSTVDYNRCNRLLYRNNKIIFGEGLVATIGGFHAIILRLKTQGFFTIVARPAAQASKKVNYARVLRSTAPSSGSRVL